MNPSYLPSSVQSILFTFAPCFSAPSFENFVALVCGWILCRGPHTISRVLVTARAYGLTDKGHGAYYRFLSRARWSADEVGHVVFDLLLPFLPEVIGVAVDDTLCHRTGPHLFGAGMHHDAAGSTYGGAGGRRVSFAFGHNWVVLSVWVPLRWNPQRGLSLPVLFRLYRAKRRCPESLYRKRTELAREMLATLVSWLPPDRRLDLAGDAEYACRTLLSDLGPPVTFTGPLPMDAALYARPAQRRGRGRPPRKGRRLASPKQRGQRGTWQRRSVQLYGREVVLLLQTFTGLWYTVTGTRPVRVVLTRDPRGRWKDRAYFCTDPQRAPEEVLTRYAQRWSLEVTFQIAKGTLGLEEPRNGWWRRGPGRRADTQEAGPKPRGHRGRAAVEHTVPLIFTAYAVVAIWFFRHGRVADAVNRQRQAKPWYGLKQEPAYGDMLAALRRQFWGSRISRDAPLRPHRAKILALLEGLAGVA